MDQGRRFAHDGVAAEGISLSWPQLMRFKRSFLEKLPGAVEQRLHQMGIDTLHGRAHFVGRHKVAVDGRALEARYVAIASGPRPTPLRIPGAEHLLTSDDFLDLDELPETMVFVGGGYISFEFAHIVAQAGAKVIILHENDRPLAHFGQDLVKRLLDKSRRIGIEIRFDSRVERIEKSGDGVKVWAKSHGAHPFAASAAIHGAGRVPDIDDLDLAAGGVESDGHRLRLSPSLQSASNAAVYAAGDAAAVGPMLTPVSELDAGVVAENLLEGSGQRLADYRGVPSVVFTIPPLASVGLSEQPACSQNLRFRVAQVDISGWYSARRVKEDTAAFKILIEEKTNRLLGAHIIGPNAEEAINLFALAMRLDLTIGQFRQLVPAYPSAAADIGYMVG